jgi:hypothetical protein
MAVKVKLYAITDEACGPEFTGPISAAPDERYAKFQEFLEKEGILMLRRLGLWMHGEFPF